MLVLLLANIVLLTISLVICFIYLHRQSCHEIFQTKYPRVLLSEVYPLLKTGDIVLFNPAIDSSFISSVLNKKFAHSGVIIQIKEDLFLAEKSIARKVSIDIPAGATLLPLLPVLKTYPGTFSIMPLKNPLSAKQNELIVNEAMSMIGATYPTTLDIVVKTFLRMPSLHCFDYVAHLLRTGQLDIPVLDSYHICEFIINLPDQKDQYRPIYDVLYDIDVSHPEV